MPSKILNVNEAADALGVSVSSVKRLVAAGALRPVRYTPRGHLHFEVRDVRRLIESSKIEGGSGSAAPDGARGSDPRSGQSSATAARVLREEVLR